MCFCVCKCVDFLMRLCPCRCVWCVGQSVYVCRCVCVGVCVGVRVGECVCVGVCV